MDKLEKRWIISFSLIALVSIAALFWPDAVDTAATRAHFALESQLNPADIAWLLTASSLVLLMTPGLAFFYGGMVGKRNIISTMLQSFICMGVIGLLWVVVGFSLSFGDPLLFHIGDTSVSVIGSPATFPFLDHVGAQPHKILGPTIPFILFALFQMKFAVITPALITGSFAERVRFIAFIFFICLFSLFIYAPLCHSVWAPTGLLGSYFGVKDFAGGTVVHMSAGFAALAGAIVLGKRRNAAHIPTNIPFVILGTGLLWFGWFGFNAGSALAANATAAMAFATTTSASATAMLTWGFFERLHGKKFSAIGACVGAVVGLVAITPAAGYVSVPESIFFGFVTSIVCYKVLNSKATRRIDDTLDVFACHGMGGIMGMILTAVFARGENASLLHGGWGVFAHHMLALLLVSAFAFFGSLLLFRVVNWFLPLRVSEDSEKAGLDLSQHDETIDHREEPPGILGLIK